MPPAPTIDRSLILSAWPQVQAGELTIDALAQQAGCTPRTVRRIARQARLEPLPRGRRPGSLGTPSDITSERRKAAAVLAAAGWAPARIARVLQVSRQAVSAYNSD